MLESFHKILADHSDELERAWQMRVARIIDSWDEQKLESFVHDLMPALKAFLLENKKQVGLQRIDSVLDKYFESKREGSDAVIKSLLIFRYVLLGEMSRIKDCALGSLEIFGFLNDLFNPFIVDIADMFGINKIINQLPDNFAPSCITNLQSLKFAGVGFFILDKDQSVIYWSQGVEDIFGLSAFDLIGRNVFDVLPGWRSIKDLQIAIEMVLKANEEKELYSIHQRVGKKMFILDIKIVAMLDENGSTVGCSVLIHDVTELKSQESELHRYEQYFENIVHDAADAIVLLDESHRITMWNKAAEKVFGFKQKHVLGKALSIIFPASIMTVAELTEMDEAVRTQGVVRRHRMETIAQDGRRVLVAFTRTRLRNEQNDFTGSSVILRDVTQQEQLRQQIVHSEKLSAVGTLAAGIAHEVGTPLTSISSLSQIMQMKTDNVEFKEKLALIQQSIDRISRTVRTLVDFSRPAAEKIENIYLNNVIDHVLRIIKYDKRLKHQDIITTLEPNIGMVRASFDQILQVFVNICLNAADAMDGKKDGRLEVKTWNAGKFVCAGIKDNGDGIPEKYQQRIFDPFFTTKKSGKGTGLGLWVSYNIIKSFSGDVKVESIAGQGAAFTILLPRVESK